MTSGESYDLVVLGSGAGGLTAAVVAAASGCSVLVLEKTDRIGGTSARSGGAVWIPGNSQQARYGIRGDLASARQYLDALVGDRGDPALREAFLQAAPRMLDFLESLGAARFALAPEEADYRQDVPGAATGGRTLRALPFDGRLLGQDFERLAWPLPELMVFGKIMVTRAEVATLLQLAVSPRAFGFATSLYVRYLGDRMRHRRGTRLVLGNALVARLYEYLKDHHVPVAFGATTKELLCNGAGIGGVVVEHAGSSRTIRAQRGVVLAGGGFPHGAPLRERHFPTPVAEYSAAYEACTGDTLRLAERAGAAFRGSADNALWFPSSIARRADGSTLVFAHIVLDRAKPGLIAVDRAGLRFVSEAVSYHEFVRAMYGAHRAAAAIPAWLVCDRRFLWQYGLGLVHPHTLALRRFIASGYLARGATLAELAEHIGVDAAGLRDTVLRYNEFARTGVDADFRKGESAYERGNGDRDHAPNPCIGPIASPPFYAVAVVPTPLGTSYGLRVDAHARVLGPDGTPIPGLYACGNDAQSVMGGEYPGAGAQLGPAMTFGYLAALAAAAERATSLS